MFKEGDKVILSMGGPFAVERRGVIIDDPLAHYYWSHRLQEDGTVIETPLAKKRSLAFYSPEQHYFAWLDNVKQYLRHDEISTEYPLS